jgi:hypothetical protein
MHNWEHFGRLPAYLLAATLVASCGGGGGDSLLNITGVSDANVAFWVCIIQNIRIKYSSSRHKRYCVSNLY